MAVTVKRVLHFKKFQPGAAKPRQASYLLFGNEEEQFLAHTITAKPDFDQILEVQTAMPPGDRALVLTVPGQDNNHPISAPAMIKVSHPGGSLFLSLLRTLYLEEGELSF